MSEVIPANVWQLSFTQNRLEMPTDHIARLERCADGGREHQIVILVSPRNLFFQDCWAELQTNHPLLDVSRFQIVGLDATGNPIAGSIRPLPQRRAVTTRISAFFQERQLQPLLLIASYREIPRNSNMVPRT